MEDQKIKTGKLFPLDKKVDVELLFRGDQIFFNYWDYMHGRDVVCEVVDGKIMKFVHTEEEAQEAEDPCEQKEISFGEFVQLVKQSVSSQEKP